MGYWLEGRGLIPTKGKGNRCYHTEFLEGFRILGKELELFIAVKF
jgi:hypothetical protein